MDPLEQIFLQSKAGSSGEGPSPQYQAFAQGQQNSLQRQKLDLEAQQEARQKQEQDVLLPLKVAQYKQTQEMQSINLQTSWQQRQALLEGAKDASDAFSTMSSMVSEFEDPLRVQSVVADFQAKHPILAGTAPVKALTDFAENYTKAVEAKARISDRAAENRALDANRSGRLDLSQQSLAERTLNDEAKLKLAQDRLEALKQRDLAGLGNAPSPVQIEAQIEKFKQSQNDAVTDEEKAHWGERIANLRNAAKMDKTQPVVRAKPADVQNIEDNLRRNPLWKNKTAEERRAEAIRQAKDLMNELNQGSSTNSPTSPSTGSKATFRYVPGKPLQPIK